MSDKGTKFIIGLALAIILAIVGFSLYRNFTGVSEINQTLLFVWVSFIAFGLVLAGLASRDKTLSFENTFIILLLIGVPIAVLIWLPKYGINLFSTLGISGSLTTELNFTGSIVEWIRNNLLLFSIILGILIWKKETIVNWIKRSIK